MIEFLRKNKFIKTTSRKDTISVNNTFTKLKRAILHPNNLILFLLNRSARIWPDKLFLQLKYYLITNKKLNLKNARTFSEKIQWLKLYNRCPEYTLMVDKYAVKQYVSSIIGQKYIIPTLGVWNSVEEIEWDVLPRQFVLKTTHGGGNSGVVICRDKMTFDTNEAKHKLRKSMKSDIYWNYREWPYKDVPKRILAEEFMEESHPVKKGDLSDYKFYCFEGEPVFCQVIRDRRSKETIDFYDMNWNHMSFVGLNPVVSNGTSPVVRPIHLDEMVSICRKLSCNMPFSRIDLYVIDDKIYFGEITFYPASGFGEFSPEEWNFKMGDLLVLPNR